MSRSKSGALRKRPMPSPEKPEDAPRRDQILMVIAIDVGDGERIREDRQRRIRRCRE